MSRIEYDTVLFSPSLPSSPVPSGSSAPSFSPTSSPLAGRFARLRSNSFHATSPRALPKEATPLPPLPFTSPLFISTPASPVSSDDLSPTSPTLVIPRPPRPFIKSCSVPHHTKLMGKWVYACRVVPEIEPLGEGGVVAAQAETAAGSASISRSSSLGRMEMAGLGQDGAREPYTIWRSWSDFVELSGRLSTAFPVVHTDKNRPHASGLPSSFYQQTPRLPRKLSLFVTRSTLVQRQDDLDLFVRRLFDMPPSVTQSPIVVEFFRMKGIDRINSPKVTTPTGLLADAFSIGLATDLEDLSARNSPSVPKRRVGVKHSTPDLRKLMLSDEFDNAILEGSFGRAGGSKLSAPTGTSRPRPSLPSRIVTLDNQYLQRNNVSRSSTASSVTITAHSSASTTPGMRNPTSPYSPPWSPPLSNSPSSPTSSFPDESPVASTVKRLTKGPLRHFRSLQDLRQAASSFREPAPPLPTSSPMVQARSQPVSRSAPPLIIPNRRPSVPVNSFEQARSRSGSSSSASSFNDGPPMSPLFQTGSGSAAFRRGPMGRLEPVSDNSHRPPRPSLPPHRNVSMPTPQRAPGGHSPTPSASSFDSVRSSTVESTFDAGRMSSDRERGLISQRSSTEYSDFGSSVLTTPPTPFLETGEAFGTYFVSESGKLTQNNKVPPPPFFPVPPSMASPSMQTTFSQDSLPPSLRGGCRRPSEASFDGGRSRATSYSSGSPSVPHPFASSPSGHSSTSSSTRPQDRDHVIFKILHTDSNFVLRVERGVTLDHLRALVDKKYAENCSISLGGEQGDIKWSLVYGQGRSSDVSSVEENLERIDTEAEFQSLLERTVTLNKVPLRVLV